MTMQGGPLTFVWMSLAFLAAITAAIVATPTRTSVGSASACNPALTHASGDFNETVASGGLTRNYILHVPPSYIGSDAVPLVLNIHGLGGNPTQQAGYTGLPAKADAEGFITVAPLGTSTGGFGVPHWNFTTIEPYADPSVPDDVAFISDLLDKLEAQLCIDATRVYSTGLSNGAMMSVRLACNLSDRIAAIAPVAGAYYPPFSPDIAAEPPCNSTRPVSIIAFHGTDDPIILFEGGPIGISGIGLSTRHIESEVMPDWAAHNGCDPTPVISQASANVRLIEYGNCDDGVVVQLYAVEGGGHTWPDAAGALPESIVGATTTEINANDLLWDFFQAHTLPAVQAPAPSATAPAATVSSLPTTGSNSDSSGMNVGIVIGIVVASTVALGGAAWAGRRLITRRQTPE
ncbi:MAG: PHB depolymerase family esterase [Dehalococcoidia bacterium]